MTKSRAFTLIELLVVITITAVLVAMLLPALKKSRVAALDIKCRNTIRQMTVASISYSMDSASQELPFGDNSPWYGPQNPGVSENWYQTTNMFYNNYAPGATQAKIVCGLGQLMASKYLPEKKEAIGCQLTDDHEQTPFWGAGVQTWYSAPVGLGGYDEGLTMVAGVRKYLTLPGAPMRSTYTIRGPRMRMTTLRKFADYPTSTLWPTQGFQKSAFIDPGKMAFWADHEQSYQALKGAVGSAPSPVSYGWGRTHELGFNVGYLDGHVKLWLDPDRRIVWANGNVQNYGTGWGMSLMDEP